MRRILQPFRRLQWQLTLTYVLITLVAALTLEGATIIGALANNKTLSWSAPDKLVGDLQWLAPQIAPYLDSASPNATALALVSTDLADAITLDRPAVKQSFEKNAAPQLNSLQIMVKSSGTEVSVAVLDIANRVVAAASSTTPMASASANAGNDTLAIDTPTQAAVTAALAGGLQGKAPEFIGTLGDGRTVVAVPLTSVAGRTVGLLVVAAHLLQPQAALPSRVDEVIGGIEQQDLIPSAFYFVALASLIGTLSGLLASRSIRRRLRRIAQAAGQWSQGALQMTIRDPGHDELGQLALDLNGMAAQLDQLMHARQALAVVEERHRLARDLHDSVKQQLFVVTMLLGTARAQVASIAEAEQTLADAEQVATAAQQELSALIRALRPVALANKGLGEALRELFAEWEQRTGIAMQASIAADLPLRVGAEQELFRVVQEALANVARHSGATRVVVEAQVTGGEFVVSVDDDGHGFDPRVQEHEGQGLRGMDERMHALGGSLVISSSPGGTRLEAHLPLAPAALATA